MTSSDKPTFASLRKDPILFLSLGFGSGLAPFAPGTAGTLVALCFVPLLALLPTAYLLAVLLVASLAGIYICGYGATKLGAKDPSSIVWDEFVGLWIALAGFPVSSFWLVSGFVVFRCFDILKPWPISVLDKKVPGGLGIMLDDILAGIMTWLVLHLVAVVLGLSV
ncbi:phosphatidylglycerophosphatase A [Gammaproteobacteria bacterium 54_18_T64]|nr:phosphatidylglycerophosphatase A [Gammaproteobacteria bacterium 54_18_T64]